MVTEVQETCRRQLNQWPSSAVDSWERASRSPLRSQASQVIIRELPEFIDAARARLEKSLDGAVKRGKLDAGQRAATLANITFTSELKDVADRPAPIERIREPSRPRLPRKRCTPGT